MVMYFHKIGQQAEMDKVNRIRNKLHSTINRLTNPQLQKLTDTPMQEKEEGEMDTNDGL